jgi:GrpB-like predicted nucleotidyltransferase (UPF0157 family)
MLGRLIVVDYDPDWPRLFESLRATVWNTVADIAISIEHVGSTAVPRLAAKPVIDIDVIVPGQEISGALARLAAIGYEHQGDLGIPHREAFRCPRGSVPHNLYLCAPTSPALANHLAIRDYLRANPADVQRYGDLKKRLAREFAHDIDGYVEAKTAFLVAILRQLRFSADSLAEIERLNRRSTG